MSVIMTGMAKRHDRITLEEAAEEVRRRRKVADLRMQWLFCLVAIVLLRAVVFGWCDASGVYDDLAAPDVW